MRCVLSSISISILEVSFDSCLCDVGQWKRRREKGMERWGGGRRTPDGALVCLRWAEPDSRGGAEEIRRRWVRGRGACPYCAVLSRRVASMQGLVPAGDEGECAHFSCIEFQFGATTYVGERRPVAATEETDEGSEVGRWRPGLRAWKAVGRGSRRWGWRRSGRGGTGAGDVLWDTA